MDPELMKTIRNRGLLLEKDVFQILEVFSNLNTAKNFLEQLERISGQKMITRGVLNNHVEYVKNFVGTLGGEDKQGLENVFVKLGISLEVGFEKQIVKEVPKAKKEQDFKIFYANTGTDKKLEVKDFTMHFRARFQSLQRILMSRPELQTNLISMGKISSDRQSLSLIGIVTEKRITKNKNMIIRLEDLTGSVNALIKFDREEVFDKAVELQLDDVIGVKASGSREMIFVHDIFYPDSFLIDKTRFNEDVNVAFISDMHIGSDRHLERGFTKFLNWLNSEDEHARKIKYIFIVGDTVDGVGIFPGQEEVLNLHSMHSQYEKLYSYLKRVPKNITMFMCPGQHDACRVAEPQPIVSKKYAPQLYELDNLILVTNPTLVKLIEAEKEFKVLMYHGASIHSFINEIRSLRLMKAHKCPAKAVEHMLKRRHLAPMHGDVVYIPNAEKDPLVIEEVPDVLCTGEVHRLDISNYNGVLIITGSCWQAQTPFEEKVGNIPDPCKVPVLNLRSRELKIFDFTIEEELNQDFGSGK